jgi:hypothetical protein
MTTLTEPQIWVLRMLRMLVESLTVVVRESVESVRTEVGTDRA